MVFIRQDPCKRLQDLVKDDTKGGKELNHAITHNRLA